MPNKKTNSLKLGFLCCAGGETPFDLAQDKLLVSPKYIKLLHTKKASRLREAFSSVRAERLELSHLAALDPKSSVSTNSTTPAFQFCTT